MPDDKDKLFLIIAINLGMTDSFVTKSEITWANYTTSH